jgi:hypothetical protein
MINVYKAMGGGWVTMADNLSALADGNGKKNIGQIILSAYPQKDFM